MPTCNICGDEYDHYDTSTNRKITGMGTPHICASVPRYEHAFGIEIPVAPGWLAWNITQKAKSIGLNPNRVRLTVKGDSVIIR